MTCIDPDRQRQVCDWLRSLGIDPQMIPQQPGAVVVAPINEGLLRVTYRRFDPRVLDPSVPLSDITGEDGRVLTTGHTTVTDTPPPEFALSGWDALLYCACGSGTAPTYRPEEWSEA